MMLTCPKCSVRDHHPKGGHTPDGYQRYRCSSCGHRFSETRAKELKTKTDQPQTAREIFDLRRQIKELQTTHQSVAEIRRIIHGLKSIEDQPPEWTYTPHPRAKRGVPTLFLSDLHWGERVFRDQVNGMNSYDMPTARKRLQRVVDTSIRLLTDEFKDPDYPGIVVLLGGDMVSGNIHEELRETNDQPILPTMMDVFQNLQAAIRQLADEFGKVCAFGVVGNHGRLDKKPRAKFGVADNYEWVLYEMLINAFRKDDRVQIINSPSFDCHFKIYGHRYMMTHGDKAFRGGTGITGPFLPWMRGNQKKQAQYRAVDLGYDTLCIGHWHQLNYLAQDTIIVNGSLKGIDEWTMSMGFEYQVPEQALWITHPKHGITYPMRVRAEDPQKRKGKDWVSWAA